MTQNVALHQSNEASSIYYTLDGSTPTTASTEWKPPRARALPLPVSIADDATLKWIADDFKGNTSAVKSKTFMIETDKPTATLNGFTEGQVFTQGRPVPVSYSCADEAGGSGPGQLRRHDGQRRRILPTSTPGTFTYTVTATDNAGNVTVLSRTLHGAHGHQPERQRQRHRAGHAGLTLGAPAQFGAVHAGRRADVPASTTANVISTAGDALLSVADPSSTTPATWSTARSSCRSRCRPAPVTPPTPAPRSTTSAPRPRR